MIYPYFQILMEPLILSVLYIWCQLNRDTIVTFWFGTRFKAMYLPWVLVAFNWILRGGYVCHHGFKLCHSIMSKL